MIQNQEQYTAIMQRIDELLQIVDDTTPTSDKNYIELDILSEMVHRYEAVYYSITTPSLIIG